MSFNWKYNSVKDHTIHVRINKHILICIKVTQSKENLTIQMSSSPPDKMTYPWKKAGPGDGMGPKDPWEKKKMYVSYSISLDFLLGLRTGQNRPGPIWDWPGPTRTDWDLSLKFWVNFFEGKICVMYFEGKLKNKWWPGGFYCGKNQIWALIWLQSKKCKYISIIWAIIYSLK
jgi:hypothetical protein